MDLVSSLTFEMIPIVGTALAGVDAFKVGGKANWAIFIASLIGDFAPVAGALFTASPSKIKGLLKTLDDFPPTHRVTAPGTRPGPDEGLSPIRQESVGSPPGTDNGLSPQLPPARFDGDWDPIANANRHSVDLDNLTPAQQKHIDEVYSTSQLAYARVHNMQLVELAEGEYRFMVINHNNAPFFLLNQEDALLQSSFNYKYIEHMLREGSGNQGFMNAHTGEVFFAHIGDHGALPGMLKPPPNYTPNA